VAAQQEERFHDGVRGEQGVGSSLLVVLLSEELEKLREERRMPL